MQAGDFRGQLSSVVSHVWQVLSQVQEEVLDWAPSVELCVFVMKAVVEWMKQQRRAVPWRRQRTLKS